MYVSFLFFFTMAQLDVDLFLSQRLQRNQGLALQCQDLQNKLSDVCRHNKKLADRKLPISSPSKNFQGFPKNRCRYDPDYGTHDPSVQPKGQHLFHPFFWGTKYRDRFLLAGLQAPKPLLCHSCLLRPCIMVENLKELTQIGIHLSGQGINNDTLLPILRDKAISLMSDVYGLQYSAVFPHKVTCISYAIEHWFPTSIPYNPDSFDLDQFLATSDSESSACEDDTPCDYNI